MKSPARCVACAMLFREGNFCAHLEAEQLHGLNRRSQPLTLKRGAALCEDVLAARPILAVAGGVIGLKHLLDDGRSTIAAFFTEGDLVDLRRRDGRMRGHLTALSKARLCLLHPGEFERILAVNPVADRIVRDGMREQMNRAMDHSADLGKKQALEKLASFVFECFYRQAEGGPEDGVVKIPIRRCDLAEYLGLQPETVSRGFRELQERRILRLRSASEIEIRRLASLKRIANGARIEEDGAWRAGGGLTVLHMR